ncbi:hypothetical protein CF392_11320 [Tamilnaduibacter salinus]|uniref:DUF2333 domain-containing protein n=1 Tax=Tamilnaduibacter salinus TaxID=1484056 RepID=A0A2A2I1A2_9GAMM|nr:DUF2333 family protein [Tamilnaduibacter salinus]PAV25382.1 hypothetical protein CF392_11320 [Tamilnaduibacter salinus]
MLNGVKQFFQDRADDVRDFTGGGVVARLLGLILVVYLIVAVVLGIYWSDEPDTFSVREDSRALAQSMDRERVTGFATTATMIRLAETLLDKPGGYIRNDLFPPGIWLDNMPSWEFGVLVQLRDMSRAMRRDISRSQSQSSEDPDLTIAEPQFHFDNNSWAIPSTESEYRRGIEALQQYLDRLSNPAQPQANFYARADNLNSWLADMETRLGSISRRLSESVGKQRIDEEDEQALKDNPEADLADREPVETPWLEIDNVFYEARGTTWAMLHLFRAIEVDFRKVLEDKNALASVRQVIVELEGSQRALWSPMILNGSGFGLMANHSLTMASYLARANSAISDLRKLLSEG